MHPTRDSMVAGTPQSLYDCELLPRTLHFPPFPTSNTTIPPEVATMSRTNIEDEETFEPIYAAQEDFNPDDTVSSFLNTAYDPTRLHPLAGLGGSGGLDYLNLEDDAGSLPGARSGGGILPSRGWSDDLTYGTGLTYITGAFPPLFFVSGTPQFLWAYLPWELTWFQL